MTEQSVQSQPFSAFIEHYKTTLKTLFSQRSDLEEISLQRGMPPFILRDLMSCKPLSTFLPEQFGGRGSKVYESLSVLEATSYESLPLSLLLGINGALFLQPVVIYGSQAAKDNVLENYLRDNKLGGLMITEPDHGSDALKMKTSYEKIGSNYKLTGTKHWAGLTGWADYWLLTARSSNIDGDLGRDIDFFIHDSKNAGIEVQEIYQNLGLYMLPYGRNKIDAVIPEDHKLIPRTNGITMMLDILHRSRLQFPGMGMGFIKRIMDEALEHCKKRFVGGSSLFSYDQVQARLAKIQASFTICSAMCAFTTEHASIKDDLSRMDLAANSIKTLITDYMQEASQSLMQLVGAAGYRLNHIAGRAVVDSRPYQIFEGSNDILYQQISESVLKMMRKAKIENLYQFLSSYELSNLASERLRKLIDFNLDPKLAQRKLVQFGEIISRIVTMQMVIQLGEKGFRSDLISNALKTISFEIEGLMASVRAEYSTDVVADYEDSSSWSVYAANRR
jgi:alkylation response protein AidB-like acyl-CoA dehydrogenase